MAGIDLTKLRYVPEYRYWIVAEPHQPQVIVSGNERAPDAHRLELARHVVPNMEPITADMQRWLARDAATYFDEDESGVWEWLTFEFGCKPASPEDVFYVYATHSNDNEDVLWTVVVRYDGDSGRFEYISHSRDLWC